MNHFTCVTDRAKTTKHIHRALSNLRTYRAVKKKSLPFISIQSCMCLTVFNDFIEIVLHVNAIQHLPLKKTAIANAILCIRNASNVMCIFDLESVHI